MASGKSDTPLKIYNSLSRKKEKFEPLNPPFVGLYVCGPTVYGDPHLGHARPAVTFDVVHRYLKHLGYKVRYVRNITDVGHLEDEEAGEGEDKIAKQARIEKLEPMEIVQYYTHRYHDALDALNTWRPSIEPQASGHIIEQINMVKDILERGYGYEVNGSVHFDVVKYNKDHPYGKLSGRKVEDMMEETRELQKQDEKKNQVDFAIWKKADPKHIMRWESPWGEGFPGWHLECSVMSSKYLGVPFDIHGGGLDLIFPHHECEIAQSVGAYNEEPVQYWMHNNMITIEGQKMSKSLGNFITLDQLFKGEHEVLEQDYSPMTVRFFLLQTHYRSTTDFSNKALKAARKGFDRLMQAWQHLEELTYPESNNSKGDQKEDKQIRKWCEQCTEHISDDFNTAKVVARLFDMAGRINAYYDGKQPITTISKETFEQMKETFNTFAGDILGLEPEEQQVADKTEELVQLLIDLRKRARERKDFETADQIRDELQKINIQLQDKKEGTQWTIEQ
jgi:cysteinyl-tRNA synthetase